jgi:hypothetical protein
MNLWYIMCIQYIYVYIYIIIIYIVYIYIIYIYRESHPQIDGEVNHHQISRELLFHIYLGMTIAI